MPYSPTYGLAGRKIQYAKTGQIPYRRIWADADLNQDESRQRFREVVCIAMALWIAIESAWKSLTGG